MDSAPVYQVRDGNPWADQTAGQVLWDYLHQHQDRDAANRIQASSGRRPGPPSTWERLPP